MPLSVHPRGCEYNNKAVADGKIQYACQMGVSIDASHIPLQDVMGKTDTKK